MPSKGGPRSKYSSQKPDTLLSNFHSKPKAAKSAHDFYLGRLDVVMDEVDSIKEKLVLLHDKI